MRFSYFRISRHFAGIFWLIGFILIVLHYVVLTPWVGGWVGGACVPCVAHLLCLAPLCSMLPLQRVMHALVCGFVASTTRGGEQ